MRLPQAGPKLRPVLCTCLEKRKGVEMLGRERRAACLGNHFWLLSNIMEKLDFFFFLNLIFLQ